MTPKGRRLFVIKCKGRELGSKEMMKQLEKALGTSTELISSY